MAAIARHGEFRILQDGQSAGVDSVPAAIGVICRAVRSAQKANGQMQVIDVHIHQASAAQLGIKRGAQGNALPVRSIAGRHHGKGHGTAAERPQPGQAFFHELKAGTVKGGDGFKKPYIPILGQTDDVRTLFCGEGERLFHDDASSGLYGAESVGIVHGIDRPVIDDVIIAFGQKLVIVRIDGGI